MIQKINLQFKMQSRPVLLFYCQHSLGMGHLVRALTLAEALAERFSVVFLNGGRFPENTVPPEGIEIINLPPLGMAEDNTVYSQDERYNVQEAHAVRKHKILDIFYEYRPHVTLIELFPFGRKKFAGELLPLLKAAKRCPESKPLVLCSLRDIMVNARKDQMRHDNRARWLVDRYFDGILMHSDPNFASLDESFRPTRNMKTPVHYTGFILPRGMADNQQVRQRQVLISAGGGMVGAPLFQVAVKAQLMLWDKLKLPMTLVAGPFLPEADWQALQRQAAGCPGLTLIRHVPNMTELLATHSASVSQCGYNTVMDILKSGIAALVVPFSQGQEDEQGNRAKRLCDLGLLRQVEAQELTVERFVAEVEQLLSFVPNTTALDLHGTSKSVEIIYDLVSAIPIPTQKINSAHTGVTCG
jgi:predicted glycosyltransferase